MSELFARFSAAALKAAPPELVGLLEAYEGENQKPLFSPIDVQAHLSKYGVAEEFEGGVAAGPLLRAAVTLGDELDDLSLALSPAQFAVLHEGMLRDSITSHSVRDIALLHANRLTAHYFDGDRFIATPGQARDLVVNLIEGCVRLLKPDFLACLISPEGLIGTYPLCMKLSDALELPLCVIMRDRQGKVRFVGETRPPAGTGLILQDVVTTGTSVTILTNAITESGSQTMGVVAIYDRRENGREFLSEQGISVLSVASRYSLRRFCESELRKGKHDDLEAAAQAFLDASLRLRLLSIRGTQPPLPTVKIAFAVKTPPPLEAFDEKGQLSLDQRWKLRDYARTTVAAAFKAGCSLVLFPEMSLPIGMDDYLCEFTKGRNVVVVGGVEYDDAMRNTAIVALDGHATRQAKLVASPYDLPGMALGDTINIFEGTCIGSFAVLICADQVDHDAIHSLRGKIDFLLVVARNRAITTFGSIAAGDAYRLNSCVVVANDHACGSSVVASPRKGDQKVKFLRADEDDELFFFEFPLSEMKAEAPSFLRQIPYPRERPREV